MELHDFKAVDLHKEEFLIDKTFQGAWKISSRDKNGNLITKQYFYYTKKEALELFKQELNN